jgi:hypothetical protein
MCDGSSIWYYKSFGLTHHSRVTRLLRRCSLSSFQTTIQDFHWTVGNVFLIPFIPPVTIRTVRTLNLRFPGRLEVQRRFVVCLTRNCGPRRPSSSNGVMSRKSAATAFWKVTSSKTITLTFTCKTPFSFTLRGVCFLIFEIHKSGASAGRANMCYDTPRGSGI